MARKLRIQYPGAMYHVINRGNYRWDVFQSAGAAGAFLAVVAEAAQCYGWKVHAYALMRNHFHLAVETGEPNLVDGMHWLQSTFATRFNRLRKENGHLFQGRYQAILIEDCAALVRVVDYIHLNPVRANIVPIDQVGAFRWSSLSPLQRKDRPAWLHCADWLAQNGLEDSNDGWQSYQAKLKALLGSQDADQEESELCRGWAIGTLEWRKAVAQDHHELAIDPGLAAGEVIELKHARWTKALQAALAAKGKNHKSLAQGRFAEPWKVQLAHELRHEVGASAVWLAEHLQMGSPNSVRSWLSRHRRNQQLSA